MQQSQQSLHCMVLYLLELITSQGQHRNMYIILGHSKRSLLMFLLQPHSTVIFLYCSQWTILMCQMFPVPLTNEHKSRSVWQIRCKPTDTINIMYQAIILNSCRVRFYCFSVASSVSRLAEKGHLKCFPRHGNILKIKDLQ